MFSQRQRRRTDDDPWLATKRIERPSIHGIVIDLINSVVVAVGGVYELTGSALVSTVTGGLAITIVGLAMGLGRSGPPRDRSPQSGIPID